LVLPKILKPHFFPVFVISVEMESKLTHCILIINFKVQLQTVSPSVAVLQVILFFCGRKVDCDMLYVLLQKKYKACVGHY
jgi:hypothetical protein